MKEWKHKEGQKCWYIKLWPLASVPNISSFPFSKEHGYDQTYFNSGNCFRTKKEAKEALTKIKRVLKGEL